jgi:3-phenylpropionate/trans-cinnamate dioxygenase ferredoxin component
VFGASCCAPWSASSWAGSDLGWVRAAALAELAEGAVTAVEVEGRKIALARVEGAVYALADNCSHRDFPLSLGEVDAEACTLTCEWHGAAFDLQSGEPRCAPATRPVAVFEVRLDGDEVLVRID